MNEGFGKDFYRKGNSVKRSGPFTEPPDSETEKLLSSSPSRKSALSDITIGAKIITHTTFIVGELILQLHTHQLHKLIVEELICVMRVYLWCLLVLPL